MCIPSGHVRRRPYFRRRRQINLDGIRDLNNGFPQACGRSLLVRSAQFRKDFSKSSILHMPTGFSLQASACVGPSVNSAQLTRLNDCNERFETRHERSADLSGNAGDQNTHQAGSYFGNLPSSCASVRPTLSRADNIGFSMPHLMPNPGSFHCRTCSSACE